MVAEYLSEKVFIAYFCDTEVLPDAGSPTMTIFILLSWNILIYLRQGVIMAESKKKSNPTTRNV